MNDLTIVLYKDDLRIHDHPALYDGADNGKVLPIYFKSNRMNQTAKDVWREETLKVLKNRFDKLNQSFLILHGDVIDIFSTLIFELDIKQVSWNVSFTKEGREADATLKKYLNDSNILVNEFNGQTLFRFKQIFNQAGKTYKIFTPFYNKCLQHERIESLPEPEIIPFQYKGKLITEQIDDHSKKEWEEKLSQNWSAGEASAFEQIDELITVGKNEYKVGQDDQATNVVAKLSPYLAVGSLSI